MLSSAVAWRDIDPGQWANLWTLLHNPGQTPHRLYALLDDGAPVSLVDSVRGPLPLDTWPTQARTVTEAATTLHRRHDAQVIAIDVKVLEEVWDRQTRAYRPDDDYDTYAARCQALLTHTLSEHAVVVPPGTSINPAHGIPYGDLSLLLGPNPPRSGCFVITVFDGDTLWWSLVGRLNDHQVDLITSSNGLNGHSGPAGGSASARHKHLVAACTSELGPVTLSHTMQLAEFAHLLSSPPE